MPSNVFFRSGLQLENLQMNKLIKIQKYCPAKLPGKNSKKNVFEFFQQFPSLKDLKL